MHEKECCRSLQGVAERVKSELFLVETEDSWERISRAIVSLQKECDSGAFSNYGEVVQVIRTCHLPLARSLTSERTRLCLSALDLITSVATALETEFDPLLAIIIPPLLSLCARTNKVIVNRTRSCVIHIVEITRLPSILPYFLRHLRDKSSSLRLSVAKGTLHCLNCCDPPDLEKDARARDIEAIIRKTARDPNADIRKISRQIFNGYKLLMPDRVERFTTPLTPTVRKYLEIKPLPVTVHAKHRAPTKHRTESPSKQQFIGTSSSFPSDTKSHSSITVPYEAEVVGQQTQLKDFNASRGARISGKTHTTVPARVNVRANATNLKDGIKKIVLTSKMASPGPSRIVSGQSTALYLPMSCMRPIPVTTAPQRSLTRGKEHNSATLPKNVLSGPRRVPLSTTTHSHTLGGPLISRPESQQSTHVPPVSTGIRSLGQIEPKPTKLVTKQLQSRSLTQPTLSQLARTKQSITLKSTRNDDIKRPRWGQSNIKRDRVYAKSTTTQLNLPHEHQINPQRPPLPSHESLLNHSSNQEAVTNSNPQIIAIVDDHPPSITSSTRQEEIIDQTNAQNLDQASQLPARIESETLEVKPYDVGETPDKDHKFAWNIGDAKTPISALLTSIQQGFEFSPSSPLSPPQSFILSVHEKQVIPLGIVA